MTQSKTSRFHRQHLQILERILRGGALAPADVKLAEACRRAGLLQGNDNGGYDLTDTGRARLARERHDDARVDRFRAQHLKLVSREAGVDGVSASVLVDDSESPLAWLARRKGRDGRTLIDATQFMAGERLRADFTRAQMSPRVTSNWDQGGSGRAKSFSPAEMTDVVVAARQRVQQAMRSAGPEFSGILLDVCCFLRGLEDVERARGWPARSAKIVLQLGLDRLSRHYGYAHEARGRASGAIVAWADAESGSADR